MTQIQATPRHSVAKQQALANRLIAASHIAPHVIAETQFIDSSEPVLSLESGYWVKSTVFDCRYYRVTVDGQGQWATSSYSDERVARMLVARVRAYLQQAA